VTDIEIFLTAPSACVITNTHQKTANLALKTAGGFQVLFLLLLFPLLIDREVFSFSGLM